MSLNAPLYQQIVLKPFEPEHFRQLIDWIPDARMLMKFAGPTYQFPLTVEQLSASLADPQRRAYQVHLLPSYAAIGHAEFHFATPGVAVLCRILLAAESHRGRGLGTQIIEQMLAIAFEEPGIHTARLRVFDFNLAAIHCYRKAGFREVPGARVQRPFGNEEWTSIQMQLDKDEYIAGRRTSNENSS